jgi:ribosomal protein L15
LTRIHCNSIPDNSNASFSFLSLSHLIHPLVESLLESKATTKSKYDIHKIVVGKEEFTAKDITVQAHAFTAAAREAIEGAGGKCELLKATTGEVIEAEA